MHIFRQSAAGRFVSAEFILNSRPSLVLSKIFDIKESIEKLKRLIWPEESWFYPKG
jgi:hypothetical protein